MSKVSNSKTGCADCDELNLHNTTCNRYARNRNGCVLDSERMAQATAETIERSQSAAVHKVASDQDYCYGEGDEGARYCGSPKAMHCSTLGDAAFWKSAEGQDHLVKCMRDDHFVHHELTLHIRRIARSRRGVSRCALAKSKLPNRLATWTRQACCRNVSLRSHRLARKRTALRPVQT